MKLASIQKISFVEKHPNADLLDVIQVLGYKCIVKRGAFNVGDLVVFIEPDSILPDKPWAAFYKSKSNRVRAVKLRSVWSFGIVESITNVDLTGDLIEGQDVTDLLGVTKYIAPEPQDLSASGPYQMGIPKTDEEKVEGISPNEVPYGQLVDVTTKIDGQSISFICELSDDKLSVKSESVGGRSFLYKSDSQNNYTRNAEQYNVFAKLRSFCLKNKVSLCLRGESHGAGIQKGNHNPHSKLPLSLALYSVWLIDERRYARKGEKFYIHSIAAELGLPVVPVIEKDVIFTPDLIKKYSEGIEMINGLPFEGIVVQHEKGSFKILNRPYDSKK